MSHKRRAESVVHALEQYLGARDAVIHNGYPISMMQQTKGFLVLALEMMMEDWGRGKDVNEQTVIDNEKR